MSNKRYVPEFKDEVVKQVVELGHSVQEVSERLGVSAHSAYKWVKAVKQDKSDTDQAELPTRPSRSSERLRYVNPMKPGDFG
ncbi:transposase [Ferrimonas sp. SCSIO 43195]|uniref:transposase n=1 Tax=Ferrimonas sp. SCSIO 43195 TaxID=2822844 RepID=UPI0021868BA4|nr:transposase [Ferrimonas sp. SCSIO 43195]